MLRLLNRKRHLSSFQIIILGFFSLIVFGCILLMLPIASNNSKAPSFIDALFTATSAVCVTGLSPFDTATQWSFFGQVVILGMIQIGGMGIMTTAVVFARIAKLKIGLAQRSIIQESISAPKVGGIVKLTSFIFRTSIIIEIVGAALMFPVFYRDFGLWQGIWYSLFHSISAFCNAGFDLMGVKEPSSSLSAYSSEPLINITIMLLIIIGGIGFLTWDDIKTNKHHFKKYRLQSKVILTTTAVLILLPALFFFFYEFSGSSSISERILNSLFQSVTLRTAGFSTVNFGTISQAGLTLMIILMLIGGSPGSTAGGMKTTTVTVLLANALSVFKRRQDPNCFGRRIAIEAVSSASTILVMYLIAAFGGGIIISCIEGMPILSCVFEAASAIGTVGLSLGITGSLSIASKIILCILMFAGRVGGLTLMFAALSEKPANISKFPQEKITVG